MSILPVYVYGDDILRKKTKPIKNIDDDIVDFVNDMFDTMYKANGIGLAANQVGFDKSLFILDVSFLDGYEKLKPFVMINPKIISFSDETKVYEEGCLSLPDLRGSVIRPKHVTIQYLDINEKEITMETDDILARVIQHEYDHLHGIYFTDKLNTEDQKLVKRQLYKIHKRKIEVDYIITDK